MDNTEVLWAGESKDLTSAATGGRIVKNKYRITREFIFESSGIIGSREEQIPLWAVRDVDLQQSLVQKARAVGNLFIRLEANDYTGKKSILLESIETPREVRDLINEHSRLARELRMRQQQTVNYSGVNPSAPFGGIPTTNQKDDDPIEKIAKLGSLLKDGLITQEEFDQQKKRLLS